MEKLKIGFLINKKYVDYLQIEILKRIKEKDDLFYEPIIIFIENKKNNSRKSFFKRIKSNLSLSRQIFLIKKLTYFVLFRFVKFFESFVVKKHFKEFDKIYNLSELPYRKIKVDQISPKSRDVSSSIDEDIKKLENQNFDILIKLGNGSINRRILNASKFGILSLCLGNYKINGNDLYGLLEALNHEKYIGFDIQLISEELNCSDFIYRGNITAHKLWLMNLAQVSQKSSIFMIKVLEEIYFNQKLKIISQYTISDIENHNFNNRSKIVFKYILKILIPYIIKNLKNKVLGFPLSCWSIAYAKTPIGLKSLEKFKEVKNPKGRFLADPFIIASNDRKIIFVEDFFFEDNKGRISAIDITNENEKFLGIVLEEDFHLSFPFVFKDSNKIYMVPECCNSNQIRLYECIEFPMKWKFRCTLMDSISAVDTILLKKEGIWFMLTNICSANINKHSSELHIFYSENLFSNDWSPIEQKNPVILDSRKARNGGMFYDKGNIYRVNQVQTPETYGYSLKINLIKILDKFKYEEQTIGEIKPFFKNDIVGTHHFNSYEDISVIDFHRRRFYKEIFK